MANPTVGDLITRVRSNVKDNSPTAANYSLTDAEVVGTLNIGMRIAQRRYAPRISGRTGTQTGLSYATNAFSDITLEANYARIVTLMLVSSAGLIYGVPLVWKDIDEFMALRGGQSFSNLIADAGGQASGVPVYWTGWRESTTTATDQGKWTVLIHPPSATSNSILGALVELEQADLSAGALTASPDLPPEGCSLVECIASYLCGKNLGRDNADSFMAMYPEVKAELAWKAGDEARNQGPRAKGRA